MTQEEYEKNIELLERRHNIERNKLHKEYAYANNPYSIGDIIESTTSHLLRIEGIAVGFRYMCDIPECIYRGVRIRKKDLTPFKTGEKMKFYQTDVVRKIN